MNGNSRLAIVNDPTRLGACIDAMAGYLADCLVLKDETMADDVEWDVSAAVTKNRVEVSKMQEDARRQEQINAVKCPHLGKLMNEEFAYKATKEQEEYLQTLAERYDHATKTIFMCLSMLEECGDLIGEEWDEVIDRSKAADTDKNVALAQYASFDKTPYYYRYRFERPNKETVTVGAISTILCAEVEELTVEWLHECDKAFCEVHGEPYEHADEIDKLVDSLAKAIARKHAMLVRKHGLEVREADIALTPRFLECRADCEFARTLASAECKVKIDCDALAALAVIAREGGETTEAKEILLLRSQQIAYVINSPPQELGLVGENAKRMNLSMLKRVLKPDMPFVCRCQCATSWSQQHGGWAQTAISQAVKMLQGWQPPGNISYITVATQARGKGGTEMPPAPGADEERPWYALPPGLKRDGLDSHGKRIVWLTSWVWQRIAHGSFEEGVVRKEILINVAMESLHQAQLMREIVDGERKLSNQGVRIKMFENSINNPSSDIASKLDIAMCRLSGFSASDIDAVFTYKPVRDLIITDLTRRTRKLVPADVVPVRYTDFADDSLKLLIPSIKARREAHGIHLRVEPHPVADMLRTIVKLRGWSPLSGQLCIDLSDLTTAHPGLRAVLEHHARIQSGFVMRTPASAKRKVEYYFDSSALVQLLKM